KTGTTNNAVQNWLITSTTKIANATWVVNDSGPADFYNTYVNGVNGYQLKFLMDKPIQQALDATYGGAPFPAPPASEVAPSYSVPAPPPSAGTGSVGAGVIGPSTPPSAPATPGK
ncbi:MAG: hypothetical protein JWP75_582, partial [Frondihabitans sp.]|nr:hypothetical protein [Frondihabitans sp.]